MPARIRARYADGVLTPLDPLDLPEGAQVALAIETAQPETPGPPEAEADARISEPEAQPPPPERERTLDGLLALVDEIHRKYPPETRGDHPPDFVKNKKHYLYGHPKEED